MAPTRLLYFGVTRNSPPGLASSIIHTAPSGRDRHVANPVPDVPAFGRRRPALAVERDAVQRLGLHAADQRRAVPLREHRPVVERELPGAMTGVQ